MQDDQGLKPKAEMAQDAERPSDDLQSLVAQIQSDPEQAAKMIRELRAEAAQRRVAAREAESKAQRLEQEAQARAEAELIEQGKWRELAQQREQELAAAQAAVAALDAYRVYTQAQVQDRLAALTPEQRALIEDEDPIKTLKRLEAAEKAGLLKPPRPAPPVVDAEAGRTPTDAEQVKLRLAGMKPKFRL
jgi:DNA repair exonuclease SbcCD ATPase subunit